MKPIKPVLIVLVATMLAGCTGITISSDQRQAIAEIVVARDDNGPPVKIHQITGFDVKATETQPAGKSLVVFIEVEVDKNNNVDPNHRAINDCLRVIENFRKHGLPAGYTILEVLGELPYGLVHQPYNRTVYYGYIINQDELNNSRPPRLTYKEFKRMFPLF